MSEQTLRHQGLDLLRLLSVVMVIGIHTAGGYFIGASSLSERWQAAPWYVLSVGAVPLFVMLSGAFMLSPGRQIGSLAHFYKRSVGRKILLPLVVWSVGYYLWHCAKEQAWLAFQWYHLWYLVMLAGLYVVTPMLRRLCERIERSDSPIYGGNRGLLILTLGSYLVALAVDLYYRSYGIQQICLLWWVQYLPYYLAGYLISRTISQLPGKGWLVALFIGSMLLHGALLIYVPYQQLGRVGVNFFPLVVLKVVSLFALCYRWRPTARLFVSASTLYPYVMGIYLVHFAVLQVVFKLFVLFLPALTACPAVSLPLRILLIALISLGVTALLHKVPRLRPLV